MVIVINLSKQIIGYNLFESFFYKLKNDGSLVFVNNYYKDTCIDYDNIRKNIQNILYNNHASSFSICLLNDMNYQIVDPIGNSIASNIYKIKEKVIKPLLNDYSFDKLYYFSLDNIKRNYDGIPYDESIKLAIDFDSLGYVTDYYDSEYSEIVFNKDEIDRINNIWEALKDSNYSLHIGRDNLKELILSFKEELYLMFSKKIVLIKEKYTFLDWYADRLEKVYKIVMNNFENDLYNDVNSVNYIKFPSNLLKETLKLEVSSYHDIDTNIIRVNMNDKCSNINREVLKYRHQLEIIGLLIYIATSDTRSVFEDGQSIFRENHWEIKTILNEENISRMLKSYNSKLKIELDKIIKCQDSEIEYEEYSPRKFNLIDKIKKLNALVVPKCKFFFNSNDIKKIENFSSSLYDRYLLGIDYNNKKISDLTIKLRMQKELNTPGTIKKGNILELSLELNKMKENVKELQKKIALYRPKDMMMPDPNVWIYYNKIVSSIKELLFKRINGTTFVKNFILVIIVSLLMYPVIKQIDLPGNFSYILSIIMLVLPLTLYLILQIIYSNKIRIKIKDKINLLVKENEKIVNELFSIDNESAMYVLDIYNLIMQKKYIDECTEKMIVMNRKFQQYNYHHDKLKEHYETSDKLISILGVDNINIIPLEIDKISEIDEDKNASNNDLYCPLNYLLLMNDIKNSAIINNSKNIEIDSNLIGFVDKFIISYDKEYHYE